MDRASSDSLPGPIGASRLPRYARVADRLARAIIGGRYPVGGFLPAEPTLATEFRVSRATIREALRQLSERGLLTRIHGVGTRVESAEIRSNFTVSIKSVAEVMQYGASTVLSIGDRACITADAREARLLGCAVGEPWLRLTGLRGLAGDLDPPIAHSEIYLNVLYAAVADDEPVPDMPFHRRITERYDQQIVAIEQTIRAVAIEPTVARALRVQAKTPGLCIVRRFRGMNDITLEVTVNIHPADRFSYNLFLTREETGEHA